MSRGYLRSRTAAARIAELQPDAKIIVVLREPASFIRSLHLELLQDHVETEKDLRKAIERDEAARRNGETDPDRQGLMYSPERVAYVEQLRRFHALFPREHVLVLIYEDFRADNEATVRRGAALPRRRRDVAGRCERRQPDGARALTALVRDGALAVHGTRPGAAARSSARSRPSRPDGCDATRSRSMRRHVLYSQPSPPDEELMLELRRRSKGEVEALSEYLGRDLVKLWGYDRIA